MTAHPEPRTAVITGAASGIGAACARLLRQEKFEVDVAFLTRD